MISALRKMGLLHNTRHAITLGGLSTKFAELYLFHDILRITENQAHRYKGN